MQSKVWPSLSMICACLYDMKHIPHSRACDFMCAEDVDTDTDAQIRRYTFTGSCSCFTNNSQRAGGRRRVMGHLSLFPVPVTNTTSCHRAENRNANAAAAAAASVGVGVELKLAPKLEQVLQKGSDNLYPRVCQKTFTIINRHVDYFFAHILPFLSRLFFVECQCVCTYVCVCVCVCAFGSCLCFILLFQNVSTFAADNSTLHAPRTCRVS